MVVGYAITTVVSLVAVFMTDWKSVLEEVADRNREERESAEAYARDSTQPLLSHVDEDGGSAHSATKVLDNL